MAPTEPFDRVVTLGFRNTIVVEIGTGQLAGPARQLGCACRRIAGIAANGDSPLDGIAYERLLSLSA